MAFWAFAGGVVGEANKIAKERAEANYEKEKRAEELDAQLELIDARKDANFDLFKEQEKYKKENANAALELFKSASDKNQRLFLSDPKFVRQLSESGLDLSGFNLSEMANLLDETANNQLIGGVSFTGYDAKGTESPYNSAMNDIKHLNTLLQDEKFYEKVESAIKGGGVSSEQWFKYLTRLENSAIVAFNAEQKMKYGEGYDPSKFNFDITEFQFIGQLAALFDGDLEKVHDETVKESNRSSMPPGKEPVVFEVELLQNGTMDVAMPFDPEDAKIIDEIASDLNMSTSQFVRGFNDLRDIPTQAEMGDLSDPRIEQSVYIKEDGSLMNKEEIARKQYGLLKDVIELKKMGFGDVDLLAQSPQKRQELRNFLTSKYGREDGGIDRYKAAMVLGYLLPTPDYFTMPKQSYSFGGKDTVRAAPTVQGREFLKDELGMTDAKIDERLQAAKYSSDTLFFMDRLYELETQELDEAGFARWVTKTLGGIVKQAPQVVNSFTKIFKGEEAKLSEDTQLVGNYKNNPDGSVTTQASLMDVVRANSQKLGIDLANITEADALKITLAARMARALDPSGRLSNQDFEVQLQRLGNSMLGSPETVARNLQRLAKEFTRESQHHAVFAEVAALGSTITPRKARLLMADQKINTLMEYDVSITGTDSAGVAPAVVESPVVTGEETQQGLGSVIAPSVGELGRSMVSKTRVFQRDDQTFPVIMYEKDGKPAYAVEIDGKIYAVDKDSTTTKSST